MTNKKIIIISVCSTIALILLCLLVVLIYKINKTTKNKKQLDRVLSFAERERMSKIEIMFQRLSVIAKTNSKFSLIFEKLTYKFDKMETHFNQMCEVISSLSLESKMLNTKTFEKEVTKIELKNESFEKEIKAFKKEANKLLKKEEFLRNEMSFCRAKLRIISELYSRKRVILDKIASRIDEINNNIKIKNKEFDKTIEVGDNEKASLLIEDIRKQIVFFAELINEGPKLQATIFGTMPTLIKKLIQLYKHAETELKVDISHIGFKDNMYALSILYDKTKKQFLDININDCKKNIIIVIKNIKALERNINSEIKSRNLFIKNYQTTITTIKKTLKQYVEIVKEYKSMPQNGKKISIELKDSIKILKKEIGILDEAAIAFESLFKDKNIPYTSRLSRMKIILNKTIFISNMMNNIYELIWEDDVILKTVKNQFLQIEQALISLRAQTIEKNILILEKEKNQLEDIYALKQQLKKQISEKPFNAKQSQEISEKLITDTTDYYKIVGGKIEMATIAMNLIKEFSTSRALDSKLNVTLSQAEQNYLAGKYAASLNLIIDGIKEFKKNRKRGKKHAW